MKTKIEVDDSPVAVGHYNVTVTRPDGQRLVLPAGESIQRAARVAHFLIDAFNQERVCGIDDAQTVMEKTLDAMAVARPARRQ